MQDTFSYCLFIIIKILGGARTPFLPPCSMVPENVAFTLPLTKSLDFGFDNNIV